MSWNLLLNILDKRRTLVEKTVSLIRFSYSEDPVTSLSKKNRHFYDIHFLYQDPICNAYCNSSQFYHDFKNLIIQDKLAFDDPVGWKDKKLYDSPLFKEFGLLWAKLKNTYITELSILAYSPIPSGRARS